MAISWSKTLAVNIVLRSRDHGELLCFRSGPGQHHRKG